jgi:hypothetical protein
LIYINTGTLTYVAISLHMPRYYLHLLNGCHVPDEEGQDFANLDHARAGAVSAGRELIAEHIRAGRPIVLHHRIDIADESGTVVATVPFGELITISE